MALEQTASFEQMNMEQMGMPGVEELLKILIDINQAQSAQSVALLMNYMNDMEEQFHSVMQELSSVKEQLAHMQNTPQTHPVKDALTKLPTKLEEKVTNLKTQFHEIRLDINEKAKQLVENFKEGGITALGNVCEFLGIKECMESLKATFEKGAADMQGSMDKIDAVSAELREVGNHTKNVGKALVGKELKETPQAKQSGFFHNMKKPYQGMKNIYDKGVAGLEKAISKMENLEATAERIGEKEKPSIMGKLQKLKTAQDENKALPAVVMAQGKSKEAAL